MTDDITPEGGTATFRFTFTLGSNSYPLSYSVNTPAIGPGTLNSISIPLKVILSGVGFTSLLPIPGNFVISAGVDSAFQGTTASVGFSGSQHLSWSTAGPASETLSLVGSQDSSSLGLASILDTQQWQVSFDLANLPLVGQVHLYTATIASQQFSSNSAPKVNFYHVVLEQPSDGTIEAQYNSAWYEAGYQLTVSALPTQSYAFQSWSSGGRTLSTSQNYTYSVEGPATLTANFAQASAQGPQGFIAAFNSPWGIAAILAVFVCIIGFGIWRSRRRDLV